MWQLVYMKFVMLISRIFPAVLGQRAAMSFFEGNGGVSASLC